MIAIDMAMPESCADCRFSQGGYMYCHAMPENFCGYVNYCEEDGRPEWCPLKAQEPRVMTLEEVKVAAGHDVWLELSGNIADDVLFAATIEGCGTKGLCTRYESLNYSAYGIRPYGWRCWTSRPDQAIREATPWN